MRWTPDGHRTDAGRTGRLSKAVTLREPPIDALFETLVQLLRTKAAMSSAVARRDKPSMSVGHRTVPRPAEAPKRNDPPLPLDRDTCEVAAPPSPFAAAFWEAKSMTVATTAARFQPWVPLEVRRDVEAGFGPGERVNVYGNGRDPNIVVWSREGDGVREAEVFRYFPENVEAYLDAVGRDQDAARRLAGSAKQWNRGMYHLVEEEGMPPSEARALIRETDDRVLIATLEAAATVYSMAACPGAAPPAAPISSRARTAPALTRADRMRSEVALASETAGSPIDAAQFHRMKNAFERHGGLIDQSVDAQRYLEMRGAEGLTFNEKTILLPPNPTTSAVYEEFIHTAQHRTSRWREAAERVGTEGAIREMEIEAAEKLINNRKAWHIPAEETRQTIGRLRKLRAE